MMGKHEKIIVEKGRLNWFIKHVPGTTQQNLLLHTADEPCTILGIYYDLSAYLDDGLASDIDTGYTFILHKMRKGVGEFPTVRTSEGEQEQATDIMLHKTKPLMVETTSSRHVSVWNARYELQLSPRQR